jgi:hypothetical protein
MGELSLLTQEAMDVGRKMLEDHVQLRRAMFPVRVALRDQDQLRDRTIVQVDPTGTSKDRMVVTVTMDAMETVVILSMVMEETTQRKTKTETSQRKRRLQLKQLKIKKFRFRLPMRAVLSETKVKIG